MTDEIVRVLRIVEYVGTRKAVEATLERSLQGTKVINDRPGNRLTIRAATIGSFPEILQEAQEEVQEQVRAEDING